MGRALARRGDRTRLPLYLARAARPAAAARSAALDPLSDGDFAAVRRAAAGRARATARPRSG